MTSPRDTRALQLGVLSWLVKPDSTAPPLFQTWRHIENLITGRSALQDDGGVTQARTVATIVQNATCWFITREMAALVQEASRTMPMTALRESDFPSDNGWLVFATPMDFQATDGVDVRTSAMVWSVRHEGIGKGEDVKGPGAVMFEWSNQADMLADCASGVESLITGSPLYPATIGTMHYGRVPWVPTELPNMFRRLRDTRRGEYSVMQDPHVRRTMNAWYEGRLDQDKVPIPPEATVTRDGSEDDSLVYEYQTPAGMRVRLQPDPAWRFLAALFWMLQDEIPGVSIERENVKKADRRYMRFHRVKMDPVSVIYWRRRSVVMDPGSGTPLSYRYLRRGFWRKQWYPSEGRHKPKYIAPTIVGHPSLPFLDRTQVNVIKR